MNIHIENMYEKGWKEDWDLANSLITLKVVSVELAGQVNSKKKIMD